VSRFGLKTFQFVFLHQLHTIIIAINAFTFCKSYLLVFSSNSGNTYFIHAES